MADEPEGNDPFVYRWHSSYRTEALHTDVSQIPVAGRGQPSRSAPDPSDCQYILGYNRRDTYQGG